jgi:type II secretory pathway predicted ATPase ExeA
VRDAKYFPSQKRPEQIQRMIRFLGDTEPMMLIIGDRGTGKSTLYHQFVNLGRLPAKTLYLDGKTSLEPNRLARHLHKSWQLGEQNAQATKRDQFDHILNAMNQFHQAGLLVIDEAHKLPFSTLAALMHMALNQTHGGIKLRIILLGTTQLVESLDNLHNPDLFIPRITLQPFSLDETHHYIEHILDKLGIGTSRQIGDAVVKQIFQKSQGIPSLVYSMAHDLFSKGQRPSQSSHIEKKPHPVATHASTTRAERLFEQHWIKAACTAMLVFTFIGIHQYQVRIKQAQTLASKTYSAPQLAKAQNSIINPPQVLAHAKSLTPKPFGYAIQLMGDYNIKKVIAFNQAQHLEKKTRILQENRQGKMWYTLDMGDYTSNKAAHRALAQLPKSLRDNPKQGRAWVKHLG